MSYIATADPDDPKMLRNLVAGTHPDREGGSHELYIFANALREKLLSGELGPVNTNRPCRNCRVQSREESRRYEATSDDPDRVPYPPSTDFSAATRSALRYAATHNDQYGALLRLLDDCYPQYTGAMWQEQGRGASYKRLAAIGHSVSMNINRRKYWYEIARNIPLSDRHAGHILGHLKRRSAA